MLAFVYFVWLQLAFLLFMLFLGSKPSAAGQGIRAHTAVHPAGLGLLVTGTFVGGVLASIVFAISVMSVPLLMTRRVDAVTAICDQLVGRAHNPKPMLLWAGLIAGFMALGIGHAVRGAGGVFPLIGHATWHAFRDLVRAEPDSYL